MSPSQSQVHQITEGILAMFNPMATIKVRQGTCTIHDMDFEVTTDHITVQLSLIDEANEYHDEDIIIDHKLFLDWLDSKSYLDVEGGDHSVSGGNYSDNTYTVTIGYADYLTDYICKSDIKGYLTEKELVNHNWEPYVAI